MMHARDYQLVAVDNTITELRNGHNPLIIGATGTGKSFIYSQVGKSSHSRIMVVSHMEELVHHNAQAFEKSCGNGSVDIEMAELSSAEHSLYGKARVVSATVQTLTANNGRRLHRFDPNDFGMLICDEAHRSVSGSWLSVVDHFKQNKDLGVMGGTATADRADKKCLSQVYDVVSFRYEAYDAITDGWLVGVHQVFSVLKKLDLSGVRSGVNDLNGAQLSARLCADKMPMAIASDLVHNRGLEKKTIVFCVDVEHAEQINEKINNIEPGVSGWICGKTDKRKRKRTLEAFDAGDLRALCNVAVLTEGYDDPSIQRVLMARPTKSRSLYTQMIGRGLRPLAGIVDKYETAEHRKDAIAQTEKPFLEVVDYIGNSGKHKLYSAIDILAGEAPDGVIAVANELGAHRTEPMPIQDLLDEAELEFERRELDKEELEREMEEEREKEASKRSHLVARAEFVDRVVDPFSGADVFRKPETKHVSQPASVRQVKRLAQLKIPNPDKKTHREAGRIIRVAKERRNKGLCTYSQGIQLEKVGVKSKDVGCHAASKILEAAYNSPTRSVPAEMVEQFKRELPPDPHREYEDRKTKKGSAA